MMFLLKQLAIARGISNDSVVFYQTFMKIIRKYGILHEPELLLQYARQTRWQVLIQQWRTGAAMVFRGKVGLRPRKIRDRAFLNQCFFVSSGRGEKNEV
ncbi:heterodisulfide reductase [Calderihabitans maritimus]|uniref:Heterodisulfide reductase n=1 Tax=Calderihabitans maritimus TaxID=1246530 RepID=A0A1Z5HQE0_9FIRM|nr:heterodisulfide reductase [Calderihabitans maritimus]